MPQSIAIDSPTLTNFVNVMSLPSGARQKAFSNLPSEEKANVFRIQLALNFINRQNLTSEQKGLILETISKVSADTYEKNSPEKVLIAKKYSDELQEKTLSIFPPNEAYEIFANMNGDKKSDVSLLRKYEDILDYNLSARKKTIRKASLIDKSNFWKAQLIYHLATTKLTKDQRAFITEVLSLMTPTAFDYPTLEGQVRNEETKTLDSLEPKAFQLFSREEVFAIFAADCVCNWYCGLDLTCVNGTCDKTKDGCGWLGGTACGYVCKL